MRKSTRLDARAGEMRRNCSRMHSARGRVSYRPVVGPIVKFGYRLNPPFPVTSAVLTNWPIACANGSVALMSPIIFVRSPPQRPVHRVGIVASYNRTRERLRGLPVRATMKDNVVPAWIRTRATSSQGGPAVKAAFAAFVVRHEKQSCSVANSGRASFIR